MAGFELPTKMTGTLIGDGGSLRIYRHYHASVAGQRRHPIVGNCCQKVDRLDGIGSGCDKRRLRQTGVCTLGNRKGKY
jgi:hypothetical protein